jgi:hypothetical protein
MTTLCFDVNYKVITVLERSEYCMKLDWITNGFACLWLWKLSGVIASFLKVESLTNNLYPTPYIQEPTSTTASNTSQSTVSTRQPTTPQQQTTHPPPTINTKNRPHPSTNC